MKKPSCPRSPIPSSSSSNDYISSVLKFDRNFPSDEQHHYHEEQYDLIFGLYDFEVPRSIHEENLEELKQIEGKTVFSLFGIPFLIRFSV